MYCGQTVEATNYSRKKYTKKVKNCEKNILKKNTKWQFLVWKFANFLKNPQNIVCIFLHFSDQFCNICLVLLGRIVGSFTSPQYSSEWEVLYDFVQTPHFEL